MQPPKRILAAQKPIRFEERLPTDHIRPNPLNPRKIFREKDINDLCDSIIEMGGIIVPLVVLEISPQDYMLLDGQRRLMAARKLRMKHVPANVISGQLSDAENLSTMFNIHMAREPWDPASRALALRKLKQVYEGISPERLAEITGMKSQAIKDANRILTFPEDIIQRCLHEGKPDYLRPSNLVEMAKAFEDIELNLPDFFEEHDREKVSRIFVKKRDTRVIRRNTDFRLIKTMFSYLPSTEVKQLIEGILRDPGLGISGVYASVEDRISSKRFDLFRSSCATFLTIMKDFEYDTLDKKTTVQVTTLLKEIRETIVQKLHLLEEQFDL